MGPQTSCMNWRIGTAGFFDLWYAKTFQEVREIFFHEVRKRLFDPRDVALQLVVRYTEDLGFAIALHPPFPALVWSRTFFALSSPICISCGVKNFFCSMTHRWQLFDCSTFPQVALSMIILPTLRLPSSKSLIHNNDSHIVKFL